MGGFTDFLFRGNLIQLAVAVIIGAAFGNLVTSFTNGLITPLLGIFGQVPTFGELYFEINGSRFLYGAVIDATITFVITAAVLYFLVVYPSQWVLGKFEKQEESKMRDCPECNSSMKKTATRCPFCTTPVLPIPLDEPKPATKVEEVAKPEAV